MTRLLSTILLLLGTACSSTKLAAEWSNPKTEPFKLAKVLVATQNARSKADRILFEQTLARHLERYGKTDATSLFEVIPNFDAMTEEELEVTVKKGGFDSVLMIRLLSVTGKLTARTTDYGVGYSTWYRSYWGTRNTEITEQQVISLETNLHVLPDFDLAWTGTTESVDLRKPETLAEELGDVVVGRLRDRGFL